MTDLQEALAPFWNHECAWKKEVERLRDELAVTRTFEREREQLLAEIKKLKAQKESNEFLIHLGETYPSLMQALWDRFQKGEKKGVADHYGT